MKPVLFSLFIAFASVTGFCQTNVLHITPEQLMEKLSKSEKPAVVQFWIASCGNAKAIIEEYKNLENHYGSEIDFYFIAITNKDSLVTTLADATSYSATLYIAEPSIEKEIYNRKKVFSYGLCKIIKQKEEDFITLYLDKKDKVVYMGEEIQIKPSRLKKLI